jgi:tripartite-type tricarboxylate transporter receptor subunit TctC
MAKIYLFVICLMLSLNSNADIKSLSNNKVISVIVGFPPGGPTDIGIRRIVNVINDNNRDVQLVVVNKPGNSAGIAAKFVADSIPDGNTILVTETSLILSEILKSPNYVSNDRLTPITSLWGNYIAIYASNSIISNSLNDVINLAKREPNKYFYASSTAISNVILGDVFGQTITPVPYKGVADAHLAVMSNQVQLAVRDTGGILPLYKENKIKVFAIVGVQKRLPEFKDVPVITEVDPNAINVPQVFSLLVPRETPENIKLYLNALFNNAMKDEGIKDFFSTEGRFILTESLTQAPASHILRFKHLEKAVIRAGNK